MLSNSCMFDDQYAWIHAAGRGTSSWWGADSRRFWGSTSNRSSLTSSAWISWTAYPPHEAMWPLQSHVAAPKPCHRSGAMSPLQSSFVYIKKEWQNTNDASEWPKHVLLNNKILIVTKKQTLIIFGWTPNLCFSFWQRFNVCRVNQCFECFYVINKYFGCFYEVQCKHLYIWTYFKIGFENFRKYRTNRK